MCAKRAFDAERGMTVAGIGLAALATGFAYVAIERNDGVPKISGAEHLAIFAMPSNQPEERTAAAAVVVPGASPAPQPPAPIDYLPTATIRDNFANQFRIRRVFKDRAVVDGPAGSLELRAGDFVRGFGRLREIRMMRGRWTAVIVPENPPDHNSR